MITCYIGLGSNLQRPEIKLKMACELLKAIPKTDLICASSVYRTSPVGKTNQNDFLNAVVSINTKLDGILLLDSLQLIERLLGRVRRERWGPRDIDLDILLFGDERITSSRLTVPHPRLHLRLFALTPLIEVCGPNKRLPCGSELNQMITACPTGKVEITNVSLLNNFI